MDSEKNIQLKRKKILGSHGEDWTKEEEEMKERHIHETYGCAESCCG